jgi:predicted aspartyl protease
LRSVATRLAHAAFCLLALLAPAACGGTNSLASLPCGLAQPMPLPVRMQGKAALVLVTLPRGSAVLLLDTGADITNFSEATARRLAIPVDPRRTLPGQTVGGPVQDGIGLATDLHVGAIVIPALTVAITETAPADGVLGLDVLQHFDIDFDLAQGRVTLHPGGLCPAQTPPWAGRFQEIRVQRSVTGRALDGGTGAKPYLMVPAALNGRPTLAMLDTGALLGGLVNPAFAAELGLSPAQLARDPQATAGGFGPSAPLSLHRFDTLDIGTERITRPVLAVGGAADRFPLVLGMDVFLSHRVWLSYATDRLFLQLKAP